MLMNVINTHPHKIETGPPFSNPIDIVVDNPYGTAFSKISINKDKS